MSAAYLSQAEKAANKVYVLATYRQLLRATRIAFAKDQPMLIAARKHARHGFNQNRRLVEGSVEAGQALEHAGGVAQILRENVVQGKLKDGVQDTYKLNIHEHTQRLDNENATSLKGTKKSFKEIKNSTF